MNHEQRMADGDMEPIDYAYMNFPKNKIVTEKDELNDHATDGENESGLDQDENKNGKANSVVSSKGGNKSNRSFKTDDSKRGKKERGSNDDPSTKPEPKNYPKCLDDLWTLPVTIIDVWDDCALSQQVSHCCLVNVAILKRN